MRPGWIPIKVSVIGPQNASDSLLDSGIAFSLVQFLITFKTLVVVRFRQDGIFYFTQNRMFYWYDLW